MAKIQKNFSLQTKQAVLIVDQNAAAYPFLHFRLFDKPFVFHLLDQFLQTVTFINDLIIVIHENNHQIRQIIKQYALQKPIKIKVFSTKDPTDFAAFLFSLSSFVQPSFFLSSLCSLESAFQILELSQWQAKALFAVDQKENLLYTYLLPQNFLQFLDQSQPDLAWKNLLAQYAQLHQIKNVVFTQEKELPQKITEKVSIKDKNSDFWLDYCQKSLAQSTEFNLSSSTNITIAPTSRLLKNNFVQENTQIGEYCVLENCYLGKNCHVGNFCHLQNTILEDNCHITHYTNLQESYLNPQTIIDQSFQSYQHKILAPKNKNPQ